MTGFRWDSSKAGQAVEQNKEYQPIPAGEYRVLIADIQDKPTKNGDGAYLAFELEIVEGPWSTRKIWENINYKNASAKAEEIAWQALAAISTAINGEPREMSLNDMIGRVIKVRTKVEQWDGKDRARVVRYMADGSDTSYQRIVAMFRPAPQVKSGGDDLPF